MAYDISKSAGAGTEELESGAAMPIIKILQDQSPQINQRKENYVAGSKAGDLFWNKASNVVPRPLKFIPLASRSLYTEWVPLTRGGGLVGSHPLTIVNQKGYRKDGYKEFLGENDLVYTTYWCILAFIEDEWQNALLTLSSSQLKVSRQLASDIDKFKYQGLPVKPPIFARSFLLDTVLEKNKAGQEYFNFKVSSPSVLDFTKDEEILTLCDSTRGQALSELPTGNVKALADSSVGDDVPY